MRNPKYVLISVAAGIIVLGLALAIAFGVYGTSDSAKASLVIKYFRALSSGDQSAVDELTSRSFESDLGLTALERGSYELFDFGESAEGTIRFLIVTQDADGAKRAVLGDMEYRRRGLVNRIESIRRVDEGRELKE